jgi:hypothetical protein
LFGLLSGTSEGHGVRAVLEIITVNGSYRLVALGRRLDSGSSLTLAATNDWPTLLPDNTWTHLTATFDFDQGTMMLYRNGIPIGATNTTAANAWNVTAGIDRTSASSPAGIKIGGSYPQNTQEKNAFNGRFDDLMFFNRVLSAPEIARQYTNFFTATVGAGPALTGHLQDDQMILSWPVQAGDFDLETQTDLMNVTWLPAGGLRTTNAETIAVTVPASASRQFFRLKKSCFGATHA